MKLLIINGPSLASLGTREVEVFGKKDYDFLCQEIARKAAASNILVEIYQSNHEGEIIDFLQSCYHNGLCRRHHGYHNQPGSVCPLQLLYIRCPYVIAHTEGSDPYHRP